MTEEAMIGVMTAIIYAGDPTKPPEKCVLEAFNLLIEVKKLLAL